jgi:hypothetical protein
MDRSTATPSELGLTDRSFVRLRFCFEAPRLREAVDLSQALRTSTGETANVRPSRSRLLGRRWSVALVTPPTPLIPAVLALWEEQMRELVQGRRGCRLVGCTTVPDGAR